jgi:hypothetical protein
MTRVVATFDPFTVAKRIGPVLRKNKSDNSRNETPMSDPQTKTTGPSDEKQDKWIEELYTDYGGEG